MRRCGWATGVIPAVLALAGCGPISAPEGNHARIELVATDDVAVQMVVSRLFAASGPGGGESGEQVLLEGDTLWVDLPVADQYEIRESGRFFVEIMDADPDVIPVNLRVWIDDTIEYDHTRPLSQGVLRYTFIRNH